MRAVAKNCVCLGFLNFAVLATAQAHVPILRYETTSDSFGRRLIFVNNPELLHADAGMCDIGDSISVRGTPCARSLHRVENAQGAYRNWFEHMNRTGAPLQYAVRVLNEGVECSRVTVRGSGFSRNAVAEGGREFVELFEALRQGNTKTHVLCPGEHFVVAEMGARSPVPRWKFFTGVVDFEIEGAPLVVENVAFHKSIAKKLSPLGYVIRTDFTAHESLVYKGVSAHTRAVASNLDFEVNDATPAGRLRVQYPTYRMPDSGGGGEFFQAEGRCSISTFPRCMGNVGSFFEPEIRDHWVTHIAPNPEDSNPKRAHAVVSDLITLVTPGFPQGCETESPDAFQTCFLMSPFYKWFYPDFGKWKYPNWGNWAVHYILQGTFTNTGTRSRTAHFGLRADGKSPIAYKGHNTGWKYFPLTKASNANSNDYFSYAVVDVPAGVSVPYQVEYILSGPAAGTLQNLVQIVN
jgi:hypothetical protein